LKEKLQKATFTLYSLEWCGRIGLSEEQLNHHITMIIAPCKNSPTSTIFDVVRETPKAVQLLNKDISNGFPVWIPKACIGEDKTTFAKGIIDATKEVTVTRLFFKSSAWKIADKSWKRVSLGMSVY
jgi:hypothetical protein